MKYHVCTKYAYKDEGHYKVLLVLVINYTFFFCPMVLINQAKLQSVQNHLFIFCDVASDEIGSRFLKAFRSEVISEHCESKCRRTILERGI